jgi:hypothetical protein
VRHGHQWRALINDNEYGRHESPERAVAALRADEPMARVPAALTDWRYTADHPLASLPIGRVGRNAVAA